MQEQNNSKSNITSNIILSNTKQNIQDIDSISYYYHIPFCKRRCSYCDFEVLNSTSSLMMDRYLSILISQTQYYNSFLSNSKIASIYFGGGTPSAVPICKLESFLSKIKETLKYSDIEITIEVNPENATNDMMAMLKNYVNRISLGCQSFNNKVLTKLGRINDRQTNINALENTLKYFDNVSVDIIVGFQNEDELSFDISMVEKYNIPHISLYSLILEDDSRLNQIGTVLNNQDTLFIFALNKLINIGYEHYEISNFCKDKKYSSHNMRYWNMSQYLGIGSGASGFVNGIIEDGSGLFRYKNHSFFKYMRALKDGVLPFEYEKIDDKTFFKDYILTGIRVKMGLSKSVLCKIGKNYIALLQKYNAVHSVFIETDDVFKLKDNYFLIQDSIIIDIYDML